MTPDAALVAALFAVDPVASGGVVVRASASEQRDTWMRFLKGLLPEGAPSRRIPVNVTDAALLGGLDLGATLQAGRPIAQAGVLAHADGGLAVLLMAERVTPSTAARVAAVLDTAEVVIERDGLCLRNPARFGVVALDEGASDDEHVPDSLLDRLAFHLTLEHGSAPEETVFWQRAEIERARSRLAHVAIDDDSVQVLCATAQALGVESLRAPLLAVRVARAAAALAGALQVGSDEVTLAARLVLAPRATRLPLSPGHDEEDVTAPPTDQEVAQSSDASRAAPPDDGRIDSDTQGIEPEKSGPMPETVLDAALAAIPPGLLASLKPGQPAAARAKEAGRSGAPRRSENRGRPIGARRGVPRAGARLNVIETLRAAVPWQTLRSREAAPAMAQRRIQIRREDFHVTRYRQLGRTTTVFVVDASGSSALNRLAEAKGAVELLLADCYVRRDSVCVLAFRGSGAELLLPPTRSLSRAKRSLAALPGGGSTPLACGLDAAHDLADSVRRRGETPIVVLLTDGRANIARDGSPGRARALADACASARRFRANAIAALWIDTSPQTQAHATALAREMGATYLPLPYAGAQAVSLAVRAASIANAIPR